MELLLSSHYMVLLRCSYCHSSRDVREFFRVIELPRAMQENSLVYSKQKKRCYTGSIWNQNLYSVLDNSKDRSSVRVTQAAACDRSAALALGKNSLSLRKLILLPPHFQIMPKSCELLLVFPHSWAGCSQGIMAPVCRCP
jgi:hypothetical protein